MHINRVEVEMKLTLLITILFLMAFTAQTAEIALPLPPRISAPLFDAKVIYGPTHLHQVIVAEEETAPMNIMQELEALARIRALTDKCA